MPNAFFPDSILAWVFCLCLIGLTVIAAVLDTRRAIIPNPLTVTTLVIGVVLNLIRAGWLGADNRPLTFLESGSVWIGLLDGFLLSLSGFALAFTLMFLFWLFGQSGGGDVKLLAAIGAWVGWQNFLIIWIVSIPVLVLWVIGRIIVGGLAVSRIRGRVSSMQKQSKTPTPGKRGRSLRITYSAPIAIATTIVILWLFRVELQLTTPKVMRASSQGAAHATANQTF